MQPRFILATLLAGFTAAQIEKYTTHFCPQGQGKLQTGPLCIGDNNQSLGPAKACPITVRNPTVPLLPSVPCPLKAKKKTMC
ncbi:hypothetical protein MY4038_004151 [Beauveria bassiana]